MATTSISLSAQCYWIFIKCSKNENLLLMGIPDGINQDEILESLVKYVFPNDNKLFQRNELSKIIENIQSNYHSKLYIIQNISSKEVKRLNDFRDYLNITLSMLIPMNENANLTAYNCIPTYKDLILIFTNIEYHELIDEKIDIPVQVSHSTAMISFPTGTTNTLNKNNQNKNLRKSIKKYENSRQDYINEQQSMQTEEFSPLIEDLPIGHRILNCCQQQIGKQRSKYLIVNDTIATSSTTSLSLSNHSNKKVLLPGSAEYAEAQLLKSILKDENNQDINTPIKNNNYNNNNNNNNNNKLEIKMNCVSSSWVNIRNIKTTPSSNNKEDEPILKNINAVLSKQSMLSCSYYLGEETLFAITHTALVLGMNADIVACDGITFLPPGIKWLFLALTCAGADGNQLASYVNNNQSIEIQEEEYQIACKISELINNATHVLPRNDIIKYINLLFNFNDNIVTTDKNNTTKKTKNNKNNSYNQKYITKDDDGDDDGDDDILDLIMLMNDIEIPLIVEQYYNKHEKVTNHNDMNLYNNGDMNKNHQNRNKKSNKNNHHKGLTPVQVFSKKEKKNPKK